MSNVSKVSTIVIVIVIRYFGNGAGLQVPLFCLVNIKYPMRGRTSGNNTSLSFIPCFSEYMKIIAIFYYPVLYYPLLVCCTLQHKAGYVFGTLLSFTHFVVLVWQKFDCPVTPEVRHQQHLNVTGVYP